MKWSNNRSVMPLDVRGCTRATLLETAGHMASAFSLGPKGCLGAFEVAFTSCFDVSQAGNPVNLLNDSNFHELVIIT